ncbi:MAG: DNA polymerase I [Synergistaceae bacterium]|nr:DNA polymerase I [Synergistaceae bacterium]
MGKKLLLIDGHGLAFRGFYALPETLTASDGTPTNAILGFTNMLLKCMSELSANHIGMFFDPKGPTSRHEMFKEYKQGRKPTPDKFKVQMPLIIDICRAMGVPVFIRDKVEADDYIVSTAKNAASKGWKVTILTADKDLFQVISDNISVMRPIKGVSKFSLYDEVFFKNEFGFPPANMADYLALVGDAADNIPGVQGIGEKGAKELVSKFGNLDGIYANLNNIAKGRRSKLEAGFDVAYVSKSLITPIETDYVPMDELNMKDVNYPILKEMCLNLGLRKLYMHFDDTRQITSSSRQNNIGAVESVFENVLSTNVEIKEIGLNKILTANILSIAESVIEDEQVFVLADQEGKISYLHPENDIELKLFSNWSRSGTLIVYGYKKMLELNSLPLPKAERIKDVEIAHYVLHPDRGGSDIKKTLNEKLPEGKDLAISLFNLWNTFHAEIKKQGLNKIIDEIDMPLCPVLAGLHKNGILVNIEKLSLLQIDLKKEIEYIEKSIEELASEKINLNSPKQVAVLLFEHLNLPPLKKTTTGYSTDMSVLEELARLPEPLCDVPSKLIEYREKSKILTGFVDPFLKLAIEGDGRIHSTFDHLATGTGRLASRDPNVQNMPVFGVWAKRFRECFIPSKDNIFVAADYSQIELRVLAHLSEEEKLIESFKENRDIHLETASWVFSLPNEYITSEQRRFAKVVNFGLLYGMSSYGLAQRLGVPRPQAAKIVERYFSALPRVRTYLKDSVDIAKDAGYTESIFGRRRQLNEVITVVGRGNSSINRVALNTPIQSSASDIAKIALIKFNSVLEKEFTGAKIILQVHDSIVCECRVKDAEKVEKRLLEVMESVDVLSIPVKAVSKIGFSLSDV